jgi:hypothetical protein
VAPAHSLDLLIGTLGQGRISEPIDPASPDRFSARSDSSTA